MKKKYKNSNSYELLPSFYQSIKEKDEKKQLSILNKFLEISSIEKLDRETQARYCHLLRLRGAANKSMKILEELIKKSDGKTDFDVKWEYICTCMYKNEYDKAEKILYDMFYAKEQNVGKPVLETMIHRYPNNTVISVLLEISRHNNYPYPEVEEDRLSYYGSQIMNYDITKTKIHMSKYFIGGGRHCNIFNENLDVDQVLNMAEEALLLGAEKSTDSFTFDVYYFDWNKQIGTNRKKDSLTGLKVITLKNSLDIIHVEAFDVKDERKYLIVNSVLNKEETKDIQKEKKKSQIEKFNRRYNRN